MHQCFLSRSRFTPCMSMEGGLSVMGDCECFYTGFRGRTSPAYVSPPSFLFFFRSRFYVTYQVYFLSPFIYHMHIVHTLIEIAKKFIMLQYAPHAYSAYLEKAKKFIMLQQFSCFPVQKMSLCVYFFLS